MTTVEFAMLVNETFSKAFSMNERREMIGIEPLEHSSDIKPMICPNCGGHINRKTYICEYCDTQFVKGGE